MDREQHVVQDAAELYAVYVMQRRAEELGIAAHNSSEQRWVEFREYLLERDFGLEDFQTGLFGNYKRNVDSQVPRFVDRLGEFMPGASFDFENVEKEMRNQGRKADFHIHVWADEQRIIPVSLKNYMGSGGITRPQVSSGTYASFAAGFIFDRIGVGMYADPRDETAVFRGSDVKTRNEILEHMGRLDLLEPLATLDALQARVKKEFLAEDTEFYDPVRVRRAVEEVSEIGISAVLEIFDLLGPEIVREKFLARAGLDGKEESLFFDSKRYVDSITNTAYHDLRERLNASDTQFRAVRHRQNLRFSFMQHGEVVLATDVPFTINTNGAWYRPKDRYTGVRTYVDKGHPVELAWGQRRPRKSKEIATSTNTYINLASAGIFGQ